MTRIDAPAGPPTPAWLRSGWVSGLACLLALPFALAALASATGLLALPDELAALDRRLPAVFRLHMASAGLALVGIPAAMALHGYPHWHRPLGRSVVALVFVAGVTALPVAAASLASLSARAGFAAQAVVWLWLLALGWRAIRQRRTGRHRDFMLAMAAVASAAVWLRPLGAAAIAAGLDFDRAYAVLAWTGWLVPLAAVGAWLAFSSWRSRPGSGPRPATGTSPNRERSA